MKNNKSFWLFLAWLVITVGLVVGLAVYQNKQASRSQTSSPVSTNVVSGSILDMIEISKHNLRGDCWLLISNKVYNVTSAIASHPGGSSPITKYCGQEATQAFATQDIGRSHSTAANMDLATYYIGDLNQAINQGQIQQTNAIVPAHGRGDDDEDDD